LFLIILSVYTVVTLLGGPAIATPKHNLLTDTTCDELTYSMV